MIAIHIHLISSNIHVHSTNLYARLKISPLLSWGHARDAWLAPLDPIDQMGVVLGSMPDAWSDIISTSDIIRCLDDVDIFQPLRKEGGARTYKFGNFILIFKFCANYWEHDVSIISMSVMIWNVCFAFW